MDYEKELKRIINKSILVDVFDALEKLEIGDYYVGAGAVAQLVWNHLCNKQALYGIDDLDIVYFNKSDLSKKDEISLTNKLNDILIDFPLKLDVKNEARVHLWYKSKFGYEIKPYTSLEEAIDTWPTTATSIGIRRKNEKLQIYAPFGLEDIFNMNVRANKKQITEEIFNKKAGKWLKKWNELTIIPWY